MKLSHRLILWQKMGFRKFAENFLWGFGLLWLLVEPASLLLFDGSFSNWRGYIVLVLVSLFIATVRSFPRISISQKLPASDVIIEIRLGDIFEQNGNVLISTNDFFDTELGKVIERKSVQGQFLERVYRGDCVELDREIDLQLSQLIDQPEEVAGKKYGKKDRYPTGTTICLEVGQAKYFLVACSKMDLECVATSDGNTIWNSLIASWREIRRKGASEVINVPIIGSGLTRTGLKRHFLVAMIVSSFIAESKVQFVCKRLRIVIYPEDVGEVSLDELEDLLKTVCV
jgi:hypothetical protein